MPFYSHESEEKLKTCCVELYLIFHEVIKEWDNTIVWGFRGQQDQHQAFLTGASKLDWPNGKHNKFPSDAVDAIPYYTDGIRWKDEHGMYLFAGYVLRVSHEMGIVLRWGGDWDGDHDTKDQTFNDLCHFEVVRPAVTRRPPLQV